MKHIKSFPFLFVLFLSALSYSSAQASVDIVNLSTQATGANPFVLALGPNNTIITVGYSCDCLKIHDVSNKASPVLKSTASTNSQPGFVTVNGNYAYITTYLGKVETWDISSSTAPVRTNVYSFGGAYGAAKERIANGYLYMTTWQSGFAGPGGVAIFDLSSSSAPTLVSHTPHSVNQSGTGDVLPIGNYLYVEDYFGKTIKVYDITNKASPALRQSIAARSENGVSYKTNQFEPWRLLNKGNALYVLDDDIIEVYDISSSTNMVYSTTTVAGRDVEGAEIRGDLLYYSSSGIDTPATNKKIQIFNIRNPFAPVEVASKINGLNNYWLVIDNSGYYYTTMASDALIGIYSPIEPPTISTASPTNVASSSITLNASVTSNNNASSTDRGFNYGLTTSYGSVASTTGTFNIGSFSQNLSGLTCATTYHYQVFAINTAGTATSSDQTFTTSSCPVVTSAPTVTLSSPTSISTTTITLNATMTSDGNASSTDHGFNYGATTAYGSTASTTGTFGTGAFSKNLTGLTCATTYHYRAFAINSAGTGTTTDSTFTTSACPARPTVSLSSPTSADTTSITLNASLDSDGSASSTDRGFYYGLTSSYGLTASTTGTFGISNFSESLTGLTCGTTYYYQAFAVNTEGTATSTGSSFVTSSCPATTATTTTTSSSSGSASSQVRNLIAMGNYQLAQQIASKYGLNVAATASNNPVVTNFVRNLSTGTSGGDVKSLQAYLNSKGYTVSTTGPGSKGNETNIFGGLTKQALIKFQKANGIPATGYFGPITRVFIQNHQ